MAEEFLARPLVMEEEEEAVFQVYMHLAQVMLIPKILDMVQEVDLQQMG